MAQFSVEIMRPTGSVLSGNQHIRSKHRPLSENAFNSALRRMGYGKDEATAHGFRVSASSILNSRGYNPDVIKAVLAHQDRDSIRRAYNRATYWEQRVSLMQES